MQQAGTCTHTKAGDSARKVSTEWFRDPCLRHIYGYYDSGVDMFGNVDALINAIEAGHAIKCYKGAFYSEPTRYM